MCCNCIPIETSVTFFIIYYVILLLSGGGIFHQGFMFLSDEADDAMIGLYGLAVLATYICDFVFLCNLIKYKRKLGKSNEDRRALVTNWNWAYASHIL